jgi:hypothetical protein
MALQRKGIFVMASIGSRNGPDRFKPAHIGGGRYVRKAGAALFTFAALFIVFGSNQAQARCKSQAYKKVDAQAYCGPILKCGAKAPPQVMVCRGAPRRWICSCTTPPPPPPPGGGQNQGSLWLEEKDPQAMLSALLAAQNGLEQRQQIDVAPAYSQIGRASCRERV